MQFAVFLENDQVIRWAAEPPAPDADLSLWLALQDLPLRPLTDEPGWAGAIEVFPPLAPGQTYVDPVFDTTKRPVELVWGVASI